MEENNRTGVTQLKAGLLGWVRPPLKCPRCLAELAKDPQWLKGAERFGTRCPNCRRILCFVREELYRKDKTVHSVWVPMLLSDRNSRFVKRQLWEPSENAWQEAGGTATRTFGFSDPSYTLCEYPKQDEKVVFVRRWSEKVCDDPVYSVLFAHGDLIVTSDMGEVYVYTGVSPDRDDQARPRRLAGSLSLGGNFKKNLPPAVIRGSWWFFLGNGNHAKFVHRHPRSDVFSEWPNKSVRCAGVLRWLGAPFAIDRPGDDPLFAALAEHDDGTKTIHILHIFRPDVNADGEDIEPIASIELPHAINCPVQVPNDYATLEDTEKAEHKGKLVWVDARGALYTIDTSLPAREWSSTLVASSGGKARGGAAGLPLPSPPAVGLPPLPPGLPPLPLGLPPLPPGLPPLPPGLPPVPPLPGTGPALSPLTVSGPAVSDQPSLQPFFEDNLCITVEPFATDYGAPGKGGVRVWSIQRARHGDGDKGPEVDVKMLCLEGGPKPETGWTSIRKGKALLSAPALVSHSGEVHHKPVSVSAMPVYTEPPTTVDGKRTTPRAQCIVISTDFHRDAYFGPPWNSAFKELRTRDDEDKLAGAPIVTPYGVFTVWSHGADFVTMDVAQNQKPDQVPNGEYDRKVGPKDRTLPVLVERNRIHRVFPAVSGNRVWIPTFEGKIYCLDLLPQSSWNDEP